MPTTSDTYCPLKWDELVINTTHNYVYACCKATPMVFVKDIKEILQPQQENLLNGVKDPSCKYCWDVEEVGGKSRRIEAIAKAKVIGRRTSLEVNFGNECNFQCSYCNPRFSSKWEQDVRKAPYQIFVDRDNYSLPETVTGQVSNEELLTSSEEYDIVRIVGGEPLLSKRFWALVGEAKSKKLSVVTNLSFSNSTVIGKIVDLCKKYEEVQLGVSIDAGKEISEFVRHGLNFDQFMQNLNQIFEVAPANLSISVQSLMTNFTVTDIQQFRGIVSKWKEQFPRLRWILSYCVSPRMQSFETLPLQNREELIGVFDELASLGYVQGAESIKSSLILSKFNSTIHKQMRHFFLEFATRKNVTIPACLTCLAEPDTELTYTKR